MRSRSLVVVFTAWLSFCPVWAAVDSNDNLAASAAATNITSVPENYLLESTVSQSVRHRLLSLSACFDLADRENKEIQVAFSSLPIAQAAIVIARAIPNPTVSMLYGWGNAFKLVIAGNGQQVGAAEEIQVLGKRTKKVGVAGANYLQTALQAEAVRFDVHNRVRRAYAELSAAHAYDDVIDIQREISKRLLNISQKRYEAGKAPGSEVLQAKLGFMQFDTQKNQAWGRIVQDSAKLALLLGEAPEHQEIVEVDQSGLFRLTSEKSTLVPDPTRTLPPIEQLLPVAWRERYDLKTAIQTAFADKKALTLAKTLRLPNPTVGFQYYFSTYSPYQFGFFDPQGILPFLQGLYPNVPQLVTSFKNPNPSAAQVKAIYNYSIFSGDAANSGNPVPDIGKDKVPFQPGYQLIVQQEMPVLYQYQGEIAKAKATWMQQVKQTDFMAAQIAADIVTAYESVQLSRANIKKYQSEILPAAAKVARLTSRGYELGKMDLGTAMLAQQQYQQLLASYFDAVVAYQNAWADLEKAIGVPLDL